MSRVSLYKASTYIKKLSRYFSMKCNNNKHSTTAGIIVIGDEILRGQVQDTNSNFMAQELYKLGLKLKKISVVGDTVEEICNEVQLFSSSFDYVLTTGGIGPTHDDVTYEGVALAFNQPLQLNPELKEICSRFYGTSNENYPGMKLAYIPKSAKLHYCNTQGEKIVYPNVSIENVYMFPGIPELLKKSLSHLGSALFKSDTTFFSKCVHCNLTEDKIANILEELVQEFPEVQFGSYPKFYDSVYKVKVTVESSNEVSTREAYTKLLALIPKDLIVNLDDL